MSGATARAFAVGLVGAVLLARCAFALGLDRMRRFKRGRDVIVATEFVRFARALGGAWIKIGQVLATRRDLFSPSATAILSGLQDQVGGRPRGDPAAFVAARLAAAGLVLRGIGKEPFASGAIAHLFLAEVEGDARPLVVKIRRDGIERLVRRDLALLRGVARLAQRLSRLDHLPLREMADSIAVVVARQADLANEASNAARLRATMQGPTALFPRILASVSDEEMIVMDYEAELLRIDAEHPELREVDYERLVRQVYQMIFVHGFFHCDLHPGNVFFRGGATIFLDCGLAVALDEAERDDFADFFLCVALNRGQRAGELLLRKAISLPDGLDSKAFRRDVAAVIARVSGVAAGQFSVAGFAMDLFAVTRRHKVIGTAQFVWMITVLLTIEGPVKVRCPGLDFQRLAVDTIVEAQAEPDAFNDRDGGDEAAPARRPVRA